MEHFDKIVDSCSVSSGGPDGEDDNFYTAIALSENIDLQAYFGFSSEMERVNEIFKSVIDRGDGKVTSSTESVSPIGVSLADIKNASSINRRQFVGIKMQETILQESESQSLGEDGSKRHYFFIEDDHQVKLKSLVVTVVFRGVFDGPRYIPGKLSIELRSLSGTSEPVSIGLMSEELQVPNTENEIGRVIIQHELKHTVIGDSLYEVFVTAETDVSYSIALGGSFARPLIPEIKREMASTIAKRNGIIEKTMEFDSLQRDLVLLKRKILLENKLADRARAASVRSEAEMERLDLELDFQDEIEDGGVTIIQQINDLKREHDEAYRLYSLRDDKKNVIRY